MLKRPFFYRSLLAVAIGIGVSGCAQLPSSNHQEQLSSNTKASLPSAEIPYSKFQLDNGLTVIVHEDRKTPMVAVNVWYKVGSKDEQPGKTGFAHLFEHLMFNGSENFQDDFFVPFLSAGATDMNGTTNSDRTNYFANVPTSALDMALWMESDRMGHFAGAISQATLDEQRGVVQNEKRLGENRPYGKTWEYMAKDTFPAGHPYSWTTIGSMDDLNNASLDDVKEWFNTYYGPSNAVIVLAGDIDEKTAREKVSHYFGDIPAGQPLSKQSNWIAKRTEDKRRVIEDRVSQPRILKVWNIPPSGKQAEQELELLATILGDGKNSRLYKRLVQEEKLATSASAWVYSRQLAGQFAIDVQTKPGVDNQKVEGIIQEELNNLLNQGPSQQELKQARFKTMADFVMKTERIGGFGGKSDLLAWGEVYHNDPGFYQKNLDMLAKASVESIQNTGKAWLSSGVYTQVTQPYPEYSVSSDHADRSQLPSIDEVKAPSFPALQQASLPNGMKVVLIERDQSPLVSLRLQFNAGLASHQGYGKGVPDFVLSMLDEGTESRSAQGIQSKLDRLGAKLSTGISNDASYIDLSTLSSSLVGSVELMQDVVMHPVFDPQDIDRLKSARVDQISRETLEPDAMIRRELPDRLYGSGHPYATPETASGTREDIQAVDREELLRYYQEWFRPDNATLIVVGDTQLNQLMPLLEQAFKAWQAPEQPLPKVDFADAQTQVKPRVYLMDQPDAQQSTIVAAQLLPAFSPEQKQEELAFNIVNDLLGGTFTSRINMNLREDKSWTYGARSYGSQALEQRIFRVKTSVQTDKTAPALAEIKKELEGVVSQQPASRAEVLKYKGNRQQQLAGRYETNASLVKAVSQMVTYQLPDNYLEQYYSMIDNISIDSVRSIAHERLTPDHMVWMIVGDLDIIEPEIKALNLGEIQVIKPQA